MIAGVTGGMIEQYIDDLDLSARSKWNHLRHIGALFRFAIKRKYLAKESIDEIEAVEMPDLEDGEIHIFTPLEMHEILAVAWSEIVPWLAIGAFAGLRSAELARLDWSEVNLQERHITVAADKVKTGARRVVPVSDNLSAWLQRYSQPHGELMSYVNWWNELAKLTDEINSTRKAAKKKANFNWHRNALRHSFCSYRLAVTGDVARVSYEAGNSPQMILLCPHDDPLGPPRPPLPECSEPQISLSKDVNSCCATGPFTSGIEHRTLLCCASSSVPSALDGLSVRQLISFD